MALTSIWTMSKWATIPVELAWKPKLATFNSLPGEYKLGALYSTAGVKDIRSGEMQDGKYSFWLNAQQQLTQHGADPKRGLYISFNGVLNDKATTFVESTQQLALWYKGPFDSRPNDSIGFGLANYVVNDRATDKQIATNGSVVVITVTMQLRVTMSRSNMTNSMLS